MSPSAPSWVSASEAADAADADADADSVAVGSELGALGDSSPGSQTQPQTQPLPSPPPAQPQTAFTVRRSTVDAALADFGATAVTFDAHFVAAGLQLDAIHPGTILASAGLQAGDTITAVDGKPLRTFDDAAGVYARLGGANTVAVQVTRAGKPVRLSVAIR